MDNSQFDKLDTLIDSSQFIDEKFKIKCKEYLKQVPTSIDSWVYSSSLSDFPYQGDIADKLDIVYHETDGQTLNIGLLEDWRCMLLSHTCDMDFTNKSREKFVSVAPIFNFKEFSDNQLTGYSKTQWESFIESVKANRITDILYLPGYGEIDDFVVLLDRIYSIDSKVLDIRVKKGTTTKILSLSQVGYYFFLIKLTYHFARYENREEVLRDY